ncbi:CDP-6-deoxy-delta-3,4-glucoseen reductase [Comamonas sp. NLF-1-9]|uniref:CDP-6-deoxy-delta-3,4-glucoseen reductase n=1 Tax=Comamonas sp. NLF-1-9 TaxID=2853163 RepID=UPI001C485074|nr:CDP-6-deoxy-delta-3,4-glucoseen reductase [Comamonas sp. NLF-1-9]QXL85162.1 CDP-6-deoxy-delta-3,4-glucoseen reductase [Comamonas sp. NLF-1-9]
MSASDSVFQVHVQPSGRSFAVQADETVLAAAIRQNIPMPYGCKDGACGSCKCRLVSGQTQMREHSSHALGADEAARGLVLACSTFAQSDLVIYSEQVTDANSFPVRKFPVRVNALQRVTDDVIIARMGLPNGANFGYFAGQYVEFILRDGSRRAYSIANAPHTQEAAPGLELHLRHTPGGRFTDHAFSAMKEKDILRIEGPFGSFRLHEDSDKPMVLLASGTGMAPIKALIEHLQFSESRRPATLYWGVRRPADLYLDAWVRERLAQMPQLAYVPVVSDALPEDAWSGRAGLVHQAVLDDFADLRGHEVYACGSPLMVDAARASFTAERGLPEGAFFADAFLTEADKQRG